MLQAIYYPSPMSYQDMQREQERLVALKKNGLKEDYLLLFQLFPVITCGRNSSLSHILLSDNELRENGVEVIKVNRGGDVTFHGPGQLMVYPILDLSYYNKDIRVFVRWLEQTVVAFLQPFGISSCGRNDLPGVWVGPAKIASIGVGCSKWITYHGIGLNISTDLTCFKWIVPCGIANVEMTSLAQLFAGPLDWTDMISRYVDSFRSVFGVADKDFAGLVQKKSTY